MSYQAQTWVNLHCPYAGGPTRAVLKELANATNEESGMAWPGLERLSFSSGYCRRAVWEALRTMLLHGVIIQIGFRKQDGDRGNERGGRGLRRGFSIVMDTAKWALDAEAIAIAATRARWWNEIEERGRKGVRVAPYRRRNTVHYMHPYSGETVHLGDDKGASEGINEGAHLLDEPNRIKEGSDNVGEGEERKYERDPRIGGMLKDLVASLERRGISGV